MAIEPLRQVETTRYVTPLREGGSLPAIVETDDLGHYVIKFRGAGQGIPVLIAELICGELGRALGLPVPELVLIELDPLFANAEPDPEIQSLLRASAGLNLAMDYLPGSIAFQPAKPRGVTPELASATVWFDALIMNVDRTPRNPNLLVWHDKLHLIDHGAALYVHHSWKDPDRVANGRFPLIKDHVLLPFATEIERAASTLRAQVTSELIDEVLALIPEEWLGPIASPFATADEHRDAYRAFFRTRLAGAEGFTSEAIAAAAIAIEAGAQ